MRRFKLTSFVMTAALLSSAAAARAQNTEPRWEVGGHVSAFGVGDGTGTVTNFVCTVIPCLISTANADNRAVEFGVGARLGRRLGRYFTFEGEATLFPRERGLTEEDFTGGRKVQVLFGAKVGQRHERFGLFVKTRPGFVYFGNGDPRLAGLCTTVFPPSAGCFEKHGRTDFALDLGGVVEFYTSARTLLRVDAGDTMLWSREHNVPVRTPTSAVVVLAPARTTHNFQGSVGFGLRF